MALAITRKHGEAIVLSKDGEILARIVVLDSRKTDGKRVKLGIEAPRDIRIMREEIADQEPKS